MAIVEQVDPQSPITQGDILNGVSLYETGDTWSDPHKHTSPICVVITRPCGVAHKGRAVVAVVQKYKTDPTEKLETFEEVRDFLTFVRDGPETPDVFYLGQIPAIAPGRFQARLDSLHTIVFPDEATLQTRLAERRVGRLSGDFARDLHARLFRAYASMGFDDVGWYATDDLKWLANVASGELGALETAISKAQAEGSLVGKKGTDLTDRVARKKSEIGPLLAELARRASESAKD